MVLATAAERRPPASRLAPVGCAAPDPPPGLLANLHRGDGATACGILLSYETQLERGGDTDANEGCWDCFLALPPNGDVVRVELDARDPGVREGDTTHQL